MKSFRQRLSSGSRSKDSASSIKSSASSVISSKNLSNAPVSNNNKAPTSSSTQLMGSHHSTSHTNNNSHYVTSKSEITTFTASQPQRKMPSTSGPSQVINTPTIFFESHRGPRATVSTSLERSDTLVSTCTLLSHQDSSSTRPSKLSQSNPRSGKLTNGVSTKSAPSEVSQKQSQPSRFSTASRQRPGSSGLPTSRSVPNEDMHSTVSTRSEYSIYAKLPLDTGNAAKKSHMKSPTETITSKSDGNKSTHKFFSSHPDLHKMHLMSVPGSGDLKRLSRKQRHQSLVDFGFGKLESYQKLELLGQGTYASVYKGRSLLTDTLVALKVVYLENEEGAPCTAIREVSLLRGLQHNNIVTLHDVIYSPRTLVLVFEFMETDLKRYMQQRQNRLDLSRVKLFLIQLFRGLSYCHRQKILHRDLKPQNLLINERRELKLADFGLARAKSVPTRTYSHEVVTLWYRPPDVLLGETDYSGHIDIWGAGCIFFEMVMGKPLFTGNSDDTQLKYIFKKMGTPTESTWPGISHHEAYQALRLKSSLGEPISSLVPRLTAAEPLGVDLLAQCLHLYGPGRITAHAAMCHPFFATFAPKDLLMSLLPSDSLVERLEYFHSSSQEKKVVNNSITEKPPEHTRAKSLASLPTMQHPGPSSPQPAGAVVTLVKSAQTQHHVFHSGQPQAPPSSPERTTRLHRETSQISSVSEPEVGRSRSEIRKDTQSQPQQQYATVKRAERPTSRVNVPRHNSGSMSRSMISTPTSKPQPSNGVAKESRGERPQSAVLWQPGDPPPSARNATRTQSTPQSNVPVTPTTSSQLRHRANNVRSLLEKKSMSLSTAAPPAAAAAKSSAPPANDGKINQSAVKSSGKRASGRSSSRFFARSIESLV